MDDLLLRMLNKQWELEKTYRPKEAERGFWPNVKYPDNFPVGLDHPEYQAFIRDAIGRMIEELMEAQNLLKNKPWKSSVVLTDVEAFFEEVSDFWHFTLRFLLIIYGDPQEALDGIAYHYFKKHAINVVRQESGY